MGYYNTRMADTGEYSDPDETLKLYEKYGNEAYTPNDEYSQLLRKYAEAGEKLKGGLDDNFKQYLEVAGEQKSDLERYFDIARGGAYSASRISALGNNERLADLGLAGNAYEAPKSGYGETMRLYEDVNLENNLGALDREKRSAMAALDKALRDSYRETQDKKAKIDSDVLLKGTEYDEKRYNMQTQNAGALMESVANGSADLSIIEYLKSAGLIGENTYGSAKTMYQKKKRDNLESQYYNINSSDYSHVKEIADETNATRKDRMIEERRYADTVNWNRYYDEAFIQGIIPENEYYEHYKKDWESAIANMSVDDYDFIIINLEAEKNRLGPNYGHIKSLLKKKKKDFDEVYKRQREDSEYVLTEDDLDTLYNRPEGVKYFSSGTVGKGGAKYHIKSENKWYNVNWSKKKEEKTSMANADLPPHPVGDNIYFGEDGRYYLWHDNKWHQLEED